MKFLKLRFGERPHFVSEQWPLLYRGPDEVHRKCIGTDIICREFACRQESSLVVYCRESEERTRILRLKINNKSTRLHGKVRNFKN